jgi:hypothetical protein
MSEKDPVFEEWHKSGNDWYMSDHDTTVFANGFVAEHPELRDLDQREFLGAVEAAVKKAFPQKFENQNRNRPAAVDGGATRGGGGGRTGEKSFASLPQEAREACDRFIKKGVFKNRQAYVEKYYEGGE